MVENHDIAGKCIDIIEAECKTKGDALAVVAEIQYSIYAGIIQQHMRSNHDRA